MFPKETYRLVMVDPLGLENWFALGVPYQTADVSYLAELKTTYASIRKYQQATYYSGTWDDSYDIWVHMLKAHRVTNLPRIWLLQPTWSSRNLSSMSFPA